MHVLLLLCMIMHTIRVGTKYEHIFESIVIFEDQTNTFANIFQSILMEIVLKKISNYKYKFVRKLCTTLKSIGTYPKNVYLTMKYRFFFSSRVCLEYAQFVIYILILPMELHTQKNSFILL